MRQKNTKLHVLYYCSKQSLHYTKATDPKARSPLSHLLSLLHKGAPPVLKYKFVHPSGCFGNLLPPSLDTWVSPIAHTLYRSIRHLLHLPVLTLLVLPNKHYHTYLCIFPNTLPGMVSHSFSHSILQRSPSPLWMTASVSVLILLSCRIS